MGPFAVNMGVFSKVGRKTGLAPTTEATQQHVAQDEKEHANTGNGIVNASDSSIPETGDEYQDGVRKVEAITTVWKKWDLVAAYAM